MKKIELPISDAALIDAYLRLNSTHKVAAEVNSTRGIVRRRLRELGVMKSREEALVNRVIPNLGKYERTKEHKDNLSNLAKNKIGIKNPFFGKKHSAESKKRISEAAKQRTEKRNPNYKHGNYLRRPRDFKNHQLAPLRNFVYNRDKHTCKYCETKGGHLHAHHVLPYWICNEAFLDSENMITVCSTCHFKEAHKGNWQHFDLSLITERLKKKYNIHGERLNELASLFKQEDAIVRPSAIYKTEDES